MKRTLILASILGVGLAAAGVLLYAVGSELIKPARQSIALPNFDGGSEVVSFKTAPAAR